MRKFLVDHTAQIYFSDLAVFVRNQFLTLDGMIQKANNGQLSYRNVEDYSADQQDDMYYLNDIFNTHIEGLIAVLNDELQKNIVNSLLVKSILKKDEQVPEDEQNGTDEQKPELLEPATALFSMAQMFLIFYDPLMISQIAETILLSNDYRSIVFDALSSTDDECLTCAAISLLYTITSNKGTYMFTILTPRNS